MGMMKESLIDHLNNTGVYHVKTGGLTYESRLYIRKCDDVFYVDDVETFKDRNGKEKLYYYLENDHLDLGWVSIDTIINGLYTGWIELVDDNWIPLESPYNLKTDYYGNAI